MMKRFGSFKVLRCCADGGIVLCTYITSSEGAGGDNGTL